MLGIEIVTHFEQSRHQDENERDHQRHFGRGGTAPVTHETTYLDHFTRYGLSRRTTVSNALADAFVFSMNST